MRFGTEHVERMYYFFLFSYKLNSIFGIDFIPNTKQQLIILTNEDYYNETFRKFQLASFDCWCNLLKIENRRRSNDIDFQNTTPDLNLFFLIRELH